MGLNGRGLVLATALILVSLPGVGDAQSPKIGKPRPAPRTAPNIPPLPPAVLDNQLAIGGEDLKARKVETRLTVEVRVNGHGPYHFLVDSGATMTTIGSDTAARTRVAISPGRDQMVRTGGGVVRVATAYADQVSVGPIERDGFRLHVAQGEDLNVLGMNFLSSLERWSVEGRWLVMQP